VGVRRGGWPKRGRDAVVAVYRRQARTAPASKQSCVTMLTEIRRSISELSAGVVRSIATTRQSLSMIASLEAISRSVEKIVEGIGMVSIQTTMLAVSGSVEAIGLRAMVGEAFVRGEPGRPIRIDLPERIELYSMSGGRITIDEMVTDLSGAPKLDSAGNLRFRFGGRIRLSGSNDGDFRGDLPLTVEYL